MIILDASVLIAHLDGHDGHHERATRLLAEHLDALLGASTITLAETLVAPARAGRSADAAAAIRRLGVVELALGERAPLRLAQLRAATERTLPDCCVLLAAQDQAGTLASFDVDLLDAATTLGLTTLS